MTFAATKHTNGALTGPTGGAGIAVEAIGLRKTYGPLEAVKGVNLQVREGEIMGFLGPVSYTHLTLPTSDLV